VANSCREWSTAKEIARANGVETGSVYGLIKRMHGEGILEADTDPAPPTRGTAYRLTYPARVALDDLLEETGRDRDEPGQLATNQRLLLVKGSALMGFQQTLADPELAVSVAWVTWLGESWLVALSTDSDGHVQRRIATVLEQAGYLCERGTVDELQRADRFRDQATANLERVGVT